MPDLFRDAQQTLKGPGVSGWWENTLPALDDVQREALYEAAVDSRITHKAIAIVLTSWGHPVTGQQVGHWRRTHV